jgi:hypothetical protein
MPPVVKLHKRESRINRFCLRIAEILLLLSLVSLQQAPASAVSRAGADKPLGHHCACATCTGESCCCESRPSQTRSPTSAPTSGHIAATGRCQMKAAPCGDSGLPSSTSRGPVSHDAALDTATSWRAIAVDVALPCSVSPHLPIRRPCRLDRPPKRLARV